jgi:hypothetical protein
MANDVPMIMHKLASLLEASSLSCRGGFHPSAEDAMPPLSNGGVVGTVVLIGNIGPQMWHSFRHSPEKLDENLDTNANPLDRWTKRILEDVILKVDGFGPVEALYPFGGPPYLPFQRWAQRAEPVHPSPTGPLIHPTYGLWHAYRGAFVFEQRLELPPTECAQSPCDSCGDRPCLNACPVNAFDGTSYDVPACTAHMLHDPAGETCQTSGCLARHACPVGKEYTYEPSQSEFHTGAFLRAQLSDKT